MVRTGSKVRFRTRSLLLPGGRVVGVVGVDLEAHRSSQGVGGGDGEPFELAEMFHHHVQVGGKSGPVSETTLQLGTSLQPRVQPTPVGYITQLTTGVGGGVFLGGCRIKGFGHL